MRSRLSVVDRKVKVLTVTSEGVLRVFTKAPIPTKEIKTRHHLQLEGEKKEVFWSLDEKIAQKVKAFKETKQKLKALELKDRQRMMSNVDNWFYKANKLAID